MGKELNQLISLVERMSYMMEDIIRGKVKIESEILLERIDRIQRELYDLYIDTYRSEYYEEEE